MTVERVVLTGFSGTGKSTVGRLLAAQLGWTLVDVDTEIEQASGSTIPAIFSRQGESAFRALEREQLLRALGMAHVVIATGGGAVVADDAWSGDVLRRPRTLVISLESAPAGILRRLQAQVALENETIERPLLAGDDPLGRISSLKASRQSAYDRADVTIPTDEVTAEDVARSIANLVAPPTAPTVVLMAGGTRSDIVVRPGIRHEIGTHIAARWPRARKAFIVTETNVGILHSHTIGASLSGAGLETAVLTVKPGETSKSWDIVGDVIGQMLAAGIQRNDIVVALGGGVIGDLAGFAASVVLRGVALVQVPTSLLAMVDSSVGGKTGVNAPTGKNLIGTFYQPPLVLIDSELLHTLPPRELNQGWAEVVKHAIIQPSTPDGPRVELQTLLERNVAHLRALREPAISLAIARNVRLKASVVAADEREASLRAILNFGHTIGHAIEAAEYRYLHGEAIAVGMRAATHIALLRGMVSSSFETALAERLQAFGLPLSAEFDPETVLDRMKSDKKSTAGVQTWVLPVEEGGVELTTNVDQSLVREALAFVRSGG
ncbi:MAG: 3-dehydroquinate synthase [Chloroflexota bacterium]|nr:3-dehydroquinate synthase [Chloroflexota bacterium]